MKYILFIFALLTALFMYACSEPDKPTVSLYLAVHRGDIDQIERHIYWGADINEVDPDGHRPMHVAAEQGRIAVVKMLLKHGAEIDAPDSRGQTAIQVALLSGRIQLADLLMKRGAKLDPSELLLKATTANITDRDVMTWLVDHGANTEQRNTEGDTPLLIAIRHLNHRTVRHLVTANADVNVLDASGKSALQIAESLGSNDISNLLRRHGAVSRD